MLPAELFVPIATTTQNHVEYIHPRVLRGGNMCEKNRGSMGHLPTRGQIYPRIGLKSWSNRKTSRNIADTPLKEQKNLNYAVIVRRTTHLVLSLFFIVYSVYGRVSTPATTPG